MRSPTRWLPLLALALGSIGGSLSGCALSHELGPEGDAAPPPPVDAGPLPTRDSGRPPLRDAGPPPPPPDAGPICRPTYVGEIEGAGPVGSLAHDVVQIMGHFSCWDGDDQTLMIEAEDSTGNRLSIGLRNTMSFPEGSYRISGYVSDGFSSEEVEMDLDLRLLEGPDDFGPRPEGYRVNLSFQIVSEGWMHARTDLRAVFCEWFTNPC